MKKTNFEKVAIYENWPLIKGDNQINPEHQLTFTIPAPDIDLLGMVQRELPDQEQLPYVHLIGIWQEPDTDYTAMNRMEHDSPKRPNTRKLEYYWGTVIKFSVPNYTSALGLLQHMVTNLQGYFTNNKGNLPGWDEEADALIAYWDFLQCYMHALHLFTLTLVGEEPALGVIKNLAYLLDELNKAYIDEVDEELGAYVFDQEAHLTYLWRDEEYPRVTINMDK